MPELPEVETTRRYLAPVVEGALIDGVEVRRDRMARRNQRPSDVSERMTGRRVLRLGRRGKFLIGDLEGGITWVSHLGMSGRFSIAAPDAPEAPHTNVVIHLRTRPQVRLVDPRMFGFVAAFTPDELDHALAAVGPDALDALPRTARLQQALERRTAPIKALLLDQHLVAGLGNIYADEVLHRARVAPQRPGGSLDAAEVAAVRAAIGVVLRAGLRHGGTSLGDLAYLLPDGRSGDYLSRLAVYGREGEQCRRCGGVVERVVVRGRSSHWCRGCQR
jgi:formamidopyrimidine-DNA glycosylase